MSIFDIFSKRQKRQRAETPDVFVYDSLPQALRVQIVHIWNDALGEDSEYSSEYRHSVKSAYDFIVNSLCREYGQFRLDDSTNRYRNCRDELIRFLLNEQNVERVLDAVELSFRVIDRHARDYNYRSKSDADKIATDAIDELNQRFKEHGVGYEYQVGNLVRIDSQLVHREVVKPALEILSEPRFAGAREEFLKAFEHYRHGRNKESLNESLKALESLLKTICRDRKWTHDSTATAKVLLDVCFSKGLIPSFWQSQYASLRALLESSVPTGRNKLSGHGQGSEPVTVEDHIVAYVLHMTAASIVFLAKADENLK